MEEQSNSTRMSEGEVVTKVHDMVDDEVASSVNREAFEEIVEKSAYVLNELAEEGFEYDPIYESEEGEEYEFELTPSSKSNDPEEDFEYEPEDDDDDPPY